MHGRHVRARAADDVRTRARGGVVRRVGDAARAQELGAQRPGGVERREARHLAAGDGDGGAAGAARDARRHGRQVSRARHAAPVRAAARRVLRDEPEPLAAGEEVPLQLQSVQGSVTSGTFDDYRIRPN